MNTTPLVMGGVWLLVGLVGCDIPSRPVLTEPQEKPKRYIRDAASLGDTSLTSVATPMFEPPAAPFDDNWETWNAYYRDGNHCGYGHVLAERLGSEPEAAVRYTIDDHLLLHVDACTVSQQLRHESIEDLRGTLRSFTATQSLGPLATHYVGTAENDQLSIVSRRGAARSTETIPWEPEFRGLVAVEQSLRRSPLKQGEVRLLKTLLPVQHRVATVRLFAGGRASVARLDGSTDELLEISNQIAVGENSLSRVLLWTDDSGRAIKSYTEAFGLLAFRTDQATATARIDSDPSSESGVAIKVAGSIERPNQAKRTAWLVRKQKAKRPGNDQDPTQPIVDLAAAAGQAIRALADGTLQVLVSSEAVANVPGFTAAPLEVTAADTQPNMLIDYNSELVRRLHQAASVAGLGPRETALEMMQTLGDVLEKSPRSLGLVKASEVAMNGVADSTGYAVLLAGLLRASKIPARVVVGLVYDETATGTMHYHAWTIAHIDGDWLPLDATLGTIAPSNRLTLLTSDFSSADLGKQLLKVLSQIGTLKITIARSQY